MKLQVWLQWFSKKNERIVGQEPIRDLVDKDYDKIFVLDPEDEGKVLGGYDVNSFQAQLLQAHVDHQIDLDKFDYQIAPYAAEEEL